MEGTRKIQCPCGQESQLVLLDDRWHYDEARHGNGEPGGGLCFNCHAPLIGEELFPAEVKETPGPAAAPRQPKTPKDELISMTRKELIELAENSGIEVPKGTKKADIIELIGQARENGPEDE